MTSVISDQALDQLFRQARSQNAWHDKPVTDDQLEAIYDLMKMGPTSANCSPMRLVFVRTPAAKEKLAPLMIETNQEKVRQAPVTAIIAYDTKFYDRIPELFPHNPGARDWFAHVPELAAMTAIRNSTLQGAYFMIAARALGLDVGPLSGFDEEGVNNQFFSDGAFKTNFICCLGHGDETAVFERSPRLAFLDACQLV
ncbi:malonic semialdehyde reductase [Alphaproteobacteria bacterium]|nr:malonic semialdehyde reductase [Alphaproteobacteria bacterium]